MITFGQHVFATLTYSRERNVEDTWSIISSDYNRFHQKLRRFHRLQIEYLRVIERHRDGYPHIHSLLQYPSACLRVSNSRYFDRDLYQEWKVLWTRGHSDYQKPRYSGNATISYVMKYLIKNQTSKTVWKKILKSNGVMKSTDVKSANSSQEDVENYQEKLPIKYHGVKLCTWSRGFDFTKFTRSE